MFEHLTVTGVKLVTFTLMAPGFPEIVWDVGQIERDAFCGRFGPPSEQAFSELAVHDGPDKWEHASQEKVLRFIRLANVPVTRPDWNNNGFGKLSMKLIDIPTITAIIARPSDGQLCAFPIDGNHRMLAREQLHYKMFSRFLVPVELEGQYRLGIMR